VLRAMFQLKGNVMSTPHTIDWTKPQGSASAMEIELNRYSFDGWFGVRG
jgi:hypothetical protein